MILGGGEGAVLREVLKYRSVKSAVMVDIDEGLVKICRKYLPSMNKGSFRDSRARIVFDDAFRFLSRCDQGEKFDVIISDLSDPIAASPAETLWSNSYFRMIFSNLAADGIFVTQAGPLSEADFKSHLRWRKMIKKSFPDCLICSYRAFVPSYHQFWGFIFVSVEKAPYRRLKYRPPFRLFNYYNPEVHKAMFALSEVLSKKLNQKLYYFY